KVIFDLAPSSPVSAFSQATGSLLYSTSAASSQTLPAAPTARMDSPYLKSGSDATCLPTMPQRLGPVLPPLTTAFPSGSTMAWQDLHLLNSLAPFSASP